jgi:predicted DNA-binding transcriptional regulator AlpA
MGCSTTEKPQKYAAMCGRRAVLDTWWGCRGIGIYMTARIKSTAPTGPASAAPNLTKKDVAARYGISVDTLERWHNARQGPARYSLPGGTIRYSEADLVAWDMARQIRQGLVA